MGSSKAELGAIRTGLWSRVSATGRIAVRLSAAGAGRLVGRGAQADRRLGETMLSELDQLKGMAMKVGQILSYMDVGLSPEVTGSLAKLRRGVRPLAGETIRGVVAQELGRPIEACFSQFNDEALAAASIGQVHRATTLDNDAVVVKVRYPAVAETMDADFKILGRLGGIAGMVGVVDGHALVSELQARVHEECDYALEARRQTRFAAFFAGDDTISVPRVHPELSTRGVLTSDYHEGGEFDGFVVRADATARARAAQGLLRLSFAPLLTEGFLHADPHPGNQLYQDDGRLVALDFGCVRDFDAEFMGEYRAFCRAIVGGDRPSFEQRACALGLAPRPKRIDWDEMWAMYQWLYAPVRLSAFTFDRAWWERGRRFTSPTAKNARHQGFPPAWIWMQRVQWGLWALLVRIGAHSDFATPYRGWLDAKASDA